MGFAVLYPVFVTSETSVRYLIGENSYGAQRGVTLGIRVVISAKNKTVCTSEGCVGSDKLPSSLEIQRPAKGV